MGVRKPTHLESSPQNASGLSGRGFQPPRFSNTFFISCADGKNPRSQSNEWQLNMGKTRHIPGTYPACHFKVFFLATSFGRSCSENGAMAPPNSLRDLLHLVQPPYRKKELRDARWEKLVQPPLSPILIPIRGILVYNLYIFIIYT